MKSNILLIGENHSGGYNYKEIIKKRKIKPSLLLVEGPFEKDDKIENVLLNFKSTCNVQYPLLLFPLISDKDKKKYLKDRNISEDTKIKGLWDPQKRIFLESINELCSEYFKLISNERQYFEGEKEGMDNIEKIFTSALPHLLELLKDANSLEKQYLYWEVNQVKSILNKINVIRNNINKMEEMLFSEYLSGSNSFQEQRCSLSVRTNNKIFLDTISKNLHPDIAVIVGVNHVDYLFKHLKKGKHNVMQEIVEW